MFVKPQEKEKEEEGVSSPQREETQTEEVPAEDEEEALPEAAPVNRPEDRHGQFLIRQLTHAHQRLLHEITSAHRMFSEVMTWKEYNHYSVVRSAISLWN